MKGDHEVRREKSGRTPHDLYILKMRGGTGG